MDSFYQNNLIALRPFLTEAVAHYLASDVATKAGLTGGRDGEDWNIQLGGNVLYPFGASHYAEKQVEAFLEKPVRRISFIASNYLFEEGQTGTIDDPAAFQERPLDACRLIEDLPDQDEFLAAGAAADLLRAADKQVLPWFPKETAGHLICFGLGLGLQLPLLTANIPFRDLIIVDPNPEFLRFSLSVLNWTQLIDELGKRGGRPYFIVGNKPAQMVLEIEGALRGAQYTRIDGTYIFQHYAANPLPDVIRQLQEKNAVLERGRGFFEDEILMLRNTLANFEIGKGMLLTGTHPVRGDQGPAIILGSGPSADGSIDTVKSLIKKGFPLITAGTGLGVALRNGITPTFHCEIENTSRIPDVLRPLAKDFDFSSITLIAPLSVHPDVAAFFEKRVFYFRDSHINSRLFTEPEEVLFLSGPTVTNLACRLAIALNFQTLALFGVDLGAKSPEQHHSKSSVYNTVDDSYFKSGRGMDALEIQVEGNFGNPVYTSRAFLYARNFFELLLAQNTTIKVLNASDGIAIAGAEAMPAKEIPGIFDSKGAHTSETIKDLPDLSNRQPTVLGALQEYCRGINQWQTAFERALEEKHPDMDSLQDAVLDLIEQAGTGEFHNPQAAVQATFSGSILSILQLAYVLDRRIAERERPKFLLALKQTLLKTVGQATEQALNLARQA